VSELYGSLLEIVEQIQFLSRDERNEILDQHRDVWMSGSEREAIEAEVVRRREAETERKRAEAEAKQEAARLEYKQRQYADYGVDNDDDLQTAVVARIEAQDAANRRENEQLRLARKKKKLADTRNAKRRARDKAKR